MKAIVTEKYGTPDILQIKELEKPVPGDNEVLVKIFAASLNYGNLVLLNGKPLLARLAFGLTKPKFKIPGGDIAGRVEAVGKQVSQFKPGDDVFGDLSGSGWGGFAEYAAVPEQALVLKPANISFEEAASIPMAGVTALQGLRDKGGLRPGQKVLINGASGGVGTFAVQIAKSLGAEVTGVCSTRNIDILQSLGPDRVIGYTNENFTKGTMKYDLILGVNGHHTMSEYKEVLKPEGVFVHVGGSEAQMFQAMALGPLLTIRTKRRMGTMLQRPSQKDLLFLKDLLENGELRPVIDRVFKLRDMADAFRYFSLGHSQGKVVISI